MSNKKNNLQKPPKVAIIGAGNLGVAIAKGLATSLGADSIWLCRRHLSKIEMLAKDGFRLSSDVKEAALEAGLRVFLCAAAATSRYFRRIEGRVKSSETGTYFYLGGDE
jgi:pyrroline-5-carboxylate reductase